MSDKTPGFSKGQKTVIRGFILSMFPRMRSVKLIRFLADDDYAYWHSIILTILAKETAMEKESLASNFVDEHGRRMGATVERVDHAIASGRIPPTFMWAGNRRIALDVKAEWSKIDILARFNAELEAAAGETEDAAASNAA